MERIKAPFNRRADHKPSSFTIVTAALAALVVLGVLTYLAVVAPRGVPGYDYYELTVEFEDTADLRVLSAVNVSGRRVGQVGTLDHDGTKAILKLQLDPGERYLKSDSTARVRGKNPVGAKYIEITPGTKGEDLENGGRIPVSQTSAAVDYPELFETFDAPTRANLQDTVDGLGKGFLGRGEDVNATIPRADDLFRDLRAVSETVNAREGAAARFAPSAEDLAGAYDPVREELAQGFDPQARALAPFAERDAATRATLSEAPPALSALREGLDASTPLLDETAGFARAAVRLTGPAPEALREANVLLREARPALRNSQPLLRSVADAVPPTVSFLARVDPVIAPARKLLQTQLRPTREFGSRGCDVQNWADNWRDALSYGVPPNTDPTSDLDKPQPGVGPLNSYRVLGVPLDDEESLNPDSPSSSGTERVGKNPYPKPCEAGPQRLPEVVP